VIATLALLCAPTPAFAQSPPEIVGPYDGAIPFRCELQDVGTGTEFPDPAADPFCVEFDKTNQNLTELGILEFALQEPARVAAAISKCFYFQRDHWTGWIVQDSAPELYHWDGDYWFDIARGVGGASVRNLRVAGVPMDATPFVPPAYQPFFDPSGGGGVMVELETNPPSHCTSKVDTPSERDRVYAGTPEFMGCIEPGGGIRGLRVGPVRLGQTRDELHDRLGPPTYSRAHFDAWCLIGKGELRVAYGASGRSQMALTSGRGQSIRGVAPGDSKRRALRRLPVQDYSSFGSGGAKGWFFRNQENRRAWVGIAHRRVVWFLVAKPRDSLDDDTFFGMTDPKP
jgi:hypothetical protein